jgi:hypothetical protein
MADINDLGLDPKYTSEVDFDNMPTGIGGTIADPPQPGVYRFRLPPSNILLGCFEKQMVPEQGERITAVLRDSASLINVSLGGQPYPIRISNTVRYVTRGDKQVAISDMAMLLKAVDCIPENGSNAAYAHALIKAGGREFDAESTLSATCSETKDIYAHNPNTGRSETQTGHKGCGQKFRVEGYTPKKGGKPVLSIPRDEEGKVATRFTCTCGAELRAWPQLQAFKPVA